MDINTLADVRLVGKGITDEWPIPQELRKEIIDRLAYLKTNAKKESVQVAACNLLQKADLINMKKRAEEQRRIEAEHARKLQLLEAAVKLGIVKPVGPGIGSMDPESSER